MAKQITPTYASSEDAIQDMAAATVAASGGGVRDSAGNVISPDNYAQVLTYNADNTVATVAFTDGINTWTQTFTYTSGNLTGISKWVKS